MKKRLPILLLLLATYWGNDLLAQACKTDSLIINTGYDPVANVQLAMGASDPNWTITSISPALLNPANTNLPTVPTTGPAKATGGVGGVNDPKSRWISFYHPGTVWSDWYVTRSANDYNFVVKRDFQIVCGNTDIQLNLKIARDNYVEWIRIKNSSSAVIHTITLDAPITTNVPSYYSSFTVIPTVSLTGLAAGTYSIEMKVNNIFEPSTPTSQNPHGVNLVGYIKASSGNLLAAGNTTCDCDCSDKCYWKVQGNTILNGNNIFGTLSNNDVRIFTNNQPVGIIKTTGRFGFGNSTPNNRVEITHGTAGNSGLRLTNLTSSSPSLTGSGKVLSVDVNGDVILVNSAGGGTSAANNGLSSNGAYTQLGQRCLDGSGAELLDDRAIPLNDHNLIFRDGGLAPYLNRIGIGTGACTPGAKLEVIRNNENNPYESIARAVAGVNLDQAAGVAQGIYGSAGNEQNRYNQGGYFIGQNGQEGTYGVLGLAVNSRDGKEAIGGWFSATGANTNIGVYGTAGNSYNSGFGPGYAGYFDGDVYSSGIFMSSDRKLKKNIEPIANALELLGKIEPKKYQFDHSKYPGLVLPNTAVNYGVIAQDIEAVLPGLVKETPVSDGNKGLLKETFKAVNYVELIPILIQAVKDQQAEIEELKANCTTRDLGAAGSAATGKDGFLAQNMPNPFSVSTTIKYQLPTGTKQGVIGIYDMNGREIRLFRLSASEKNGALTIQGGDLKPGMYIYSLIIDGAYFDSKKMILTSN